MKNDLITVRLDMIGGTYYPNRIEQGGDAILACLKTMRHHIKEYKKLVGDLDQLMQAIEFVLEDPMSKFADHTDVELFLTKQQIKKFNIAWERSGVRLDVFHCFTF